MTSDLNTHNTSFGTGAGFTCGHGGNYEYKFGEGMGGTVSVMVPVMVMVLDMEDNIFKYKKIPFRSGPILGEIDKVYPILKTNIN